jgi:hypothetical protein
LTRHRATMARSFPYRNWAAGALLAIFCTACDSGSSQEGVLALVNRSSVMPGTPVPYTVLNLSLKEISIPNCCSRPVVYVQRWNGSSWGESFAVGDPCLLLCPSRLLLIPHGSGYQDSVAVDTVGRYRFCIKYGQGSGISSGHAVYTGAFDIAFGLD